MAIMHDTVETQTYVKPSLISRLTGRHRRSARINNHNHHHHNNAGMGTTTSPRTTRRNRLNNNTTTTAGVGHHHKRRPSLSDKISGAMLKLKGSLTHRPGEKAAGTRRMHGTDGRGSRRSGRLQRQY